MTVESNIRELIEAQKAQLARYEQTISQVVAFMGVVRGQYDYILASDPQIAGTPMGFAPDFQTLQERIESDRAAAGAPSERPKRVSVLVPELDLREPIFLTSSYVTYHFAARVEFAAIGARPYFWARNIREVCLDGGWYRQSDDTPVDNVFAVDDAEGLASEGNIVINAISDRRINGQSPAWQVVEHNPDRIDRNFER